MKRDQINHDDSINSDAIISRKSKRSLKIPRTFTKDQIVKVGSYDDDDDDDNCINKNFKYHDHYDSDGKKINNNGIDNHITYINTFTTMGDSDDSKHNDSKDQNMGDKIVSFNLNNDDENNNNDKSPDNNNNSSSSIGNINENIMTSSGNTSPGGERPVSPVGLSRRTTAVKFKSISTTGVGK
jgi:hypothetical protein